MAKVHRLQTAVSEEIVHAVVWAGECTPRKPSHVVFVLTPTPIPIIVLLNQARSFLTHSLAPGCFGHVWHDRDFLPPLSQSL